MSSVPREPRSRSRSVPRSELRSDPRSELPDGDPDVLPELLPLRFPEVEPMLSRPLCELPELPELPLLEPPIPLFRSIPDEPIRSWPWEPDDDCP